MLYPRVKSMLALLPAVAAVAVAGCGSSSSSSSAGGGGQSSSSAAAPASSASGGGGYGPSSASSTASAAPQAGRALISTKHNKLGTILAVGPRHMTVYLFERDHGKMSSCTGACAVAWPPVLGTPAVQGATRSSELGTIRRADGRTQVTYGGHPLYRFIKDKDSGDAYGQGSDAFGAKWYVLAPSGHKIDPT